MSKFRLITKDGDGIAIAYRLMQEGNDVEIYVEEPELKNLYKGILPRVPEWNRGLDDDTILVFDMVKQGKEADVMRSAGYKVFGASEVADDLELKRDFGIEVASNAGIEVPKWEAFTDFDKAIKWVKDLDSACVVKPEANKEGIETFVSQSPEQMIRMLEHYKEKWKGKPDFVMQEVKEGIEVSSEVWCVNGEIIPNSYNNTLETKKLMNDNKGGNTGCTGSLVKFNMCPSLYDELFVNMQDWLRKNKYSGCLDINCIISDGVPYFLEFTARMGYSAIYAFVQGLNMPFGEFIETIASGRIPEIEPSTDWLGALRLTILPYPNTEEKDEHAGIPVSFDDNDENIFPLHIYKTKNGYAWSGHDGVLFEITERHPSLKVLWEYIYMRTDTLEIPDAQYRTDLFQNTSERVNQLYELGYCDESLYDNIDTLE